ncbi:hypothetical protein ACTNDN_15745 [Niallia sp. HCP3S3_B10]
MNRLLAVLLFGILCALIFIGIEIHLQTNDLKAYLDGIDRSIRRLPENF